MFTVGEKKLNWDDVEVLLIGAGTMGASLAQAYAQSGFNVGVVDICDEILERAWKTIDAEFEAARRRGIYTELQAEEIRGRILTTTSYEEACRGKNLQLVIETATEDIAIKKEIFRALDRLCAPDVILASNSSSLDTNILARETRRPDKVVWMHFFYLPHKNRAGEYAGTDTASPASFAAAAKFMKLAGKVATPILSSRKGGAADVIFVALLLEAARMVDEGFALPAIEAAGCKAFSMPVGFLSLMDANGIPLGIATMLSFSDPSNPEDPLFKAYGNFFTPPGSYKRLIAAYESAEDKTKVKWVSEEETQKTPEDPGLVIRLCERFLAVGFMTAVECVEAGVIALDEVDKLCQNAFLWREGPFALMNKKGIGEALHIVKSRAELVRKQGIDFPLPERLLVQAQKREPWPVVHSPVIYSVEKGGRVARITLTNPQAANALDNRVFEDLRSAFRRANDDRRVQVIIFDTAPIKTFISGANVSDFVKNINAGDFRSLIEDTARWQEVLFHEMTGGGKPKIAIIDGAALGGGVEVALALALDPKTVVIITDRTSYALPETRLGIYPGLRGTLTLPRVIHRTTGDAELALALSRYYILAGGTPSSSPRLLKHLGLANFLVPAKDRDAAAEVIAQSVITNKGRPLTKKQLKGLDITELPSELTIEEKEEIRVVSDFFGRRDLVPTLFAFKQGWADVFFSGHGEDLAKSFVRRITDSSYHAVVVADWLISRGFADYQKGRPLDESAQWELDNCLELTFRHPDALEGLSALVERRNPQFNTKFPFQRFS